MQKVKVGIVEYNRNEKGQFSERNTILHEEPSDEYKNRYLRLKEKQLNNRKTKVEIEQIHPELEKLTSGNLTLINTNGIRQQGV